MNITALENEVFAVQTKPEVQAMEYDELLDFSQEMLVDSIKSSTESFMIMALYETSALEAEEAKTDGTVAEKKNIFKKIWDFIKEVAKKIVENVKKFFTFIVSSVKKFVSGFSKGEKLDKEVAKEDVEEAKKENPGKKIVDPKKIKESIKELDVKIKNAKIFKIESKKILTGIKVGAAAGLVVGIAALAKKLIPSKSSEEYYSTSDYHTIFEKANTSEIVTAAENVDSSTVGYFESVIGNLEQVSHNVDIFDDVNRPLDSIDKSITDSSSKKDISDATKAVQQVTKIGHDYTSDIFASASAISNTFSLFDRIIKRNAKAIARKNSIHSKVLA